MAHHLPFRRAALIATASALALCCGSHLALAQGALPHPAFGPGTSIAQGTLNNPTAIGGTFSLGDVSGQVRRSASGTVYRNIGAIADDIKNPKDFGAICDGQPHALGVITQINTTAAGPVSTIGWTIDGWRNHGFPHAVDLTELIDGAAIQEAAYAISPTAGGVLFLPNGGCLANKSITITSGLTVVDGFGGGSIFTYPNHNFNLFINSAPLVTYQDFQINPGGGGGISAPTGSTEVFGIYDPYVPLATPVVGATANYKMTVRHVSFTNLWSGILSGGGDDLLDYVKGSFFTGPTGSSGIKFDTPYVDTRQVWNSSIYNATTGISGLGSSGNIDIVNTELPGNGRCFIFQPGAGYHIASLSFEHSWCDSGTIGGGLLDARASGSYIARFRAGSDSWFGGSAGHGIELYGSVWGAVFTPGTQFYGNTLDGLHVDTSVGNAKGLVADGVLGAGNGGAVVSIGAGVTHWAVINSLLSPQADFGANGYGLYAAAGASDYYRVANNDLTGNTGATPISGNTLTGLTGTHTVVANNLQ